MGHIHPANRGIYRIFNATAVGGVPAMVEKTREIMTPAQAAEYLQINRETVYRYIRDGKLIASRAGRSYRISKRSIDLLRWEMQAESGLELREYSGDELAGFLKADQMNGAEQEIADRFMRAIDHSSVGGSLG